MLKVVDTAFTFKTSPQEIKNKYIIVLMILQKQQRYWRQKNEFGIIGYGNIARKFVKSITYTSGGRVHAIASHSLDENDSYLQNHPLVKLYRDYEDF